MKMMKFALFFALWAANFAGLNAKESAKNYVLGHERVPGQMIIKLSDEKTDLNFLKSFGVMNIEEIPVSFGTFKLLTFSDDKNFYNKMDLLGQQPGVLYAEPNFIYHLVNPLVHQPIRNLMDETLGEYLEDDGDDLVYSPGVPMFDRLWGLHNTGQGTPSGSASTEGADIDALRAWAIETGSRNITIAVIDTGIDYTHRDLADNMWVNLDELNGTPGEDSDGNGFIDDIYGYDFSGDRGDPMDGHGHGTHCAGTIGALHQNDFGVAGVMAEVSMVAIKFLSDSGSGTTANAIRSVDYATMLNVDIMSNSWGGGAYSEALKEAIERAHEAGILFVAAAGNSSSNNDVRPMYPANYEVPNVISVAATTGTDQLASFSSFGQNTVHIAAPGFHTLSTTPNNRHAVFSGTSMATPHVAGALGLLLAHEGGRLPVEEVVERLIATSDPVPALRGRVIQSARLNAYNLLTDTRPDRNEPDPDAWQTIVLDEVWESNHPYSNNERLERVFHVEGAKYIRLIFTRYDLEQNYDFVRLYDARGAEGQRITGRGQNVASDFIEGDTVKAVFTSDHSVTAWGFLVEEIQYQ